MGRPRTPTNVLDKRGAFEKDPQRKRSAEPKPTADIGDPPKSFDRKHKATWKELMGIIPPGVLFNSDRWSVEALVCLMVEFRRDPTRFSAAQYARLENLLGKMGMTPSDRSKVVVKQEKKADGWDDL